MALNRLLLMGLFTALAVIMHVVESWMPVFGNLPGAKLGLANIISLFVLLSFSVREAMLVALCRIIIGSLLAGTLGGPAFIISMSGAIVSILATYIFTKKNIFSLSIIGISIIGAAAHNTGQIIAASVIMASIAILNYLPFLLLLSIPTGIVVGAAVSKLNLFIKTF